ncbi:hypothetical protein ACHAWX_001960 [Stephanocyclus meneghinianus]
MVNTAATGSSVPRLKFRTVQPVDIPRCYQLEQLSYPPEEQASKSTLQHRQHHAAPFFRCVLLKKQSEILGDEFLSAIKLSVRNNDENGEDGVSRQSSNDEACHHVHHSSNNHLIGYVCGTRCHEFAPVMELKPSIAPTENGETHASRENLKDLSSSHSTNNNNNTHNQGNRLYPYPMKHEPSGPYLAIHSLVIQSEYRNQGVARCLLENYIKSIETFNAGADSAKPTISKCGSLIKDKVQKRPTKIEKLILVTKSHLLEFFVSMGFRWRATIFLGTTSVYELEREVKSCLPSTSPPSPLPASALKCALPFLHQQPNNSMEHDCYLVDAFANPKRCGSGNSAAIVVLDDNPSKLIAERQSKLIDDDHGGQWGIMNKRLNEFLSNVVVDEDEEEELAEMRAEVWMHFVAREFHQPATAFVWPIFDIEDNEEIDWNEEGSNRSTSDVSGEQHQQQQPLLQKSSIQNDFREKDAEDSSNCEDENEKKHELHHYIRFYTRTGIEVDMCAHATLAAASILFRRHAMEQHQSSNHLLARNKEPVLAFHSRKNIILRANRAPPSPFDESLDGFHSPAQPRTSPDSPRRTSFRNNTFTPLSSMTGSSHVMRLPNIIRIAMDYPWRPVDPVPPGKDGQVAVIAMLRRAFFGAWSVVAPEDEDSDHDTDEMAFSLSVHHVLFIGVTKGGEDLLIELSVEGFELLCGRSVDYVALKQGWNGYTRGVIVCCEVPEAIADESASVTSGDSQHDVNSRPGNVTRNLTLSDIVNPHGQLDFRSRYFEPKVGVNEDPVSGWPHCALGPYFGKRRGKQRLIGIQESDRTGIVECILKEDERKVCIIGSTITTVTGKLQMQA